MSSEVVNVDPESIAAHWPGKHTAYAKLRPGIRRTTRFEVIDQIGEGTYG
jgi:hypothetical protein